MLNVAGTGRVGFAAQLTQPHLPSRVYILVHCQTGRSLESHRAEFAVVLSFRVGLYMLFIFTFTEKCDFAAMTGEKCLSRLLSQGRIDKAVIPASTPVNSSVN